MSAKEAYKKPAIHIQVLPDELLTEVLRHATWVPYGLDLSDLVFKRMQSSRAKEVMRAYRLSLVTRRYLIRVCKKWHRLAFLFLYEWILVSRFKHLQGIITAIESSNHCAHTGWCTKRLDIDIKWSGDETRPQKSQVGSLLLRLLQALPNLQVLSVGNCNDHSWLQPSVSHTWCPNLMFLNWIHEINVLDSEIWMYFLESHPNLIGINPSTTTPPVRQLDSFSHSLKAWTTGYISSVPITNTFTSLRRLSMNLHTFFIADPEWYDHFLTWPLPSLQTLQLNFINYHGETDLNIHLNTIQPLFRFLPNLRRIDLILPVWPQVWSGYVFPPTVRVLGVRVASKKPKRQLVRWLLQILNHIVGEAYERLEVQFLDEKTMEGILMHGEYIMRYGKEWKVLERWLDPDGVECSSMLE